MDVQPAGGEGGDGAIEGVGVTEVRPRATGTGFTVVGGLVTAMQQYRAEPATA